MYNFRRTVTIHQLDVWMSLAKLVHMLQRKRFATAAHLERLGVKCSRVPIHENIEKTCGVPLEIASMLEYGLLNGFQICGLVVEENRLPPLRRGPNNSNVVASNVIGLC